MAHVAPIQRSPRSQPNTAQFVQKLCPRGLGQLAAATENISSDLTGLQLVKVQSRFWYNEQLESRNFLIPGSIAIIMTLIGTLLTALVVAREWSGGQWRL